MGSLDVACTWRNKVQFRVYRVKGFTGFRVEVLGIEFREGKDRHIFLLYIGDCLCRAWECWVRS